MIAITTKRLQLRPIQLDDAAAVFAYRSNMDANRYQDWIPESVEEVETKFSGTLKPFNQTNTWYQLAIVESESGKLIGDIGVHILAEGSRAVEIGCTLNTAYQSRGYAGEAIQAVIDKLFRDYGKQKIVGSVDPRNKASLSLMKRLGFKQVAFIKKAFKIRGELVDDVRFELLYSDQ